MDLKDKIAIVTGAARGIGRATAVALAGAGARGIALADRDRAGLEASAAAVRDAGGEPLPLEIDVSRYDELERMISRTRDHFGALHVLHNNAGIGEGADMWPDVPSPRVLAIADVNFRAVIAATQLALEPIRESGGGAIVQTASGAAFAPLPPQAVYAATKAGIVHFTRSCAPLAESHRVRVSCVCPGLTDTQMVRDSNPDGQATWLQAVIDSVELLTPEDIARAVLELVRDPNSGGQIVSVDNAPRG